VVRKRLGLAGRVLLAKRLRDRASEVSTSTSAGSAVPWEERSTSSACCAGESSLPNAAWIPPCAFDELFACKVVFVARPTRAPERSAETAAASPAAPLPITSTSKDEGTAITPILPIRLIRLTYPCSRG